MENLKQIQLKKETEVCRLFNFLQLKTSLRYEDFEDLLHMSKIELLSSLIDNKENEKLISGLQKIKESYYNAEKLIEIISLIKSNNSTVSDYKEDILNIFPNLTVEELNIESIKKLIQSKEIIIFYIGSEHCEELLKEILIELKRDNLTMKRELEAEAQYNNKHACVNIDIAIDIDKDLPIPDDDIIENNNINQVAELLEMLKERPLSNTKEQIIQKLKLESDINILSTVLFNGSGLPFYTISTTPYTLCSNGNVLKLTDIDNHSIFIKNKNVKEFIQRNININNNSDIKIFDFYEASRTFKDDKNSIILVLRNSRRVIKNISSLDISMFVNQLKNDNKIINILNQSYNSEDVLMIITSKDLSV